MQLNSKSFGSGEPLIILHGAFGSLDNWQSIAKHFASKFRVFIVDQRNHGKSPHTDKHNFLAMSDDLFEFMNQQNIPSSHLLGHSMGGKVAMLFTSRYSEKVKKLIVVDSSPTPLPTHLPEQNFLFKAIDKIDNQEFHDRREAEKAVSDAITEEKFKFFMYKNLRRNIDGRIVWKFNSNLLRKEYYRIIEGIDISESINTQTLFLRAPKSGFMMKNDLNVIDELFTNYELIEFPNSSHWIHVDEAGLFKEAVIRFLVDN